MAHPVAGVILAGGTASRMGGGDKGLLTIGGRTLLQRVIDRLSPQVEAMVLNANGDPRRFSAAGLDVVADPLPEPVGPLGGILAGMRWASARHPGLHHIVTVAADTPFFPGDLVARLWRAQVKATDIVLARSLGRVHPVFGLWPTDLAADLELYIMNGGNRRLQAYAGERHAVILADFPAGPAADPFFNINTPDDLKQVRDRIEGKER
ncbi:molybdenum cofactor guanylyltransferase MobA [Nitratireductor sp. ZSWI3]|uniref:molybdenum cofactor guanylyltransferase MobA n=1 Tax=Nitratireductor sp. ZSWI3 TaxID=2966359 RepID=UPI00214FEBBD|nr:molybdenum cofactor guanylyltransferase MobA [Nitratireductor sp. ZSWI3]MCR4266699.1 molybdenum cofactor guanylyltransferase MobA [Nitratireductor sp. ZSWI3]